MKKLLLILLVLIIALSPLNIVFALDSDSPVNNHDGILYTGERGQNVFRLQMRLRELNYLPFVPTGSYLSMTKSAVAAFQANNQLTADGSTGTETMSAIMSYKAKRATLSTNIKLNGPSATRQQAAGALIDWKTASPLLNSDKVFTVYDFNTGTAIHLRRTGGTNHAYVEPENTAEAANLKKIFVENSWECRAVLVDIAGTLYAASLKGAPYGEDKIGGNDMEGHLELFFDGSVSDINNLPDMDHSRMIQKASGNLQ